LPVTYTVLFEIELQEPTKSMNELQTIFWIVKLLASVKVSLDGNLLVSVGSKNNCSELDSP
jgi:hypothetical protein